MTLRDVLTAFLLAGCFGFLSYVVGEMRGKASGYAQCVAEEDNDGPTRHFTVGAK